MPALKVLSVLLFVVAVALMLGALVLLGSEETLVPDVAGSRSLSGGLYAAFGVAFFAIGVVLLLVERGHHQRAEAEAAAARAQPAPAPRRTVEIKRTQMDIGSPASEAPADEPHADLDEVNRKISRLKVQYGMGEVGRETFRIMMDALEKEKAEIQLRQMDEERGSS